MDSRSSHRTYSNTPSDQFTLLNLAGSTVHVSFPVLPTVPATADIPPGGTQVFNIGNAAPGVYDYVVQAQPVGWHEKLHAARQR